MNGMHCYENCTNKSVFRRFWIHHKTANKQPCEKEWWSNCCYVYIHKNGCTLYTDTKSIFVWAVNAKKGKIFNWCEAKDWTKIYLIQKASSYGMQIMMLGYYHPSYSYIHRSRTKHCNSDFLFSISFLCYLLR